jgi:hypothetical protein
MGSASIIGIDSSALMTGAVGSISANAFRTKLFRHISNHLSGQGYLSKPMYTILKDKNTQAADRLSAANPEAASMFNAYMTAGFPYDKKARFVTAIDGVSQTVDKINSLSLEA